MWAAFAFVVVIEGAARVARAMPRHGAAAEAVAVAHDGLAFFNVLGEVEGQAAKGDFLIAAAAASDGRRCRPCCRPYYPARGPAAASVVRGATAGGELLDDLELDEAFGQGVILVDGDAHGDELAVVVLDAVVRDGAFGGAAAVVRVDAMG